LRFHDRVIVVAQISNRALVAAWALEDADALPMAQQRLVEIVDGAGVLWKQGLQEIVRGIGSNLFANQAEADTYSPHVSIDRQDWLLTAKK